ncbi:MAG: hypothetical protein ACP5QI_09005, partial [Candidatus Bathyarchaeia archaeon]
VDKRLSEVDLTAWFEGRIDGVLEGNVTLDRFERDMFAFVSKMVEQVASIEIKSLDDGSCPKCPACGKAMTLVSQGFKWSSYACRSCGVGKVLPK